MNDIAKRNLHWAWGLVDTFAAAGVCEAVISPGSRSTPLALACERHPSIRTWIQVDERCAAFFALGLAKVYGMPCVLICTSGTAPAHWYPAVIEASESNIPLLLLSADRPPELHDCGANQTIDQSWLFGVHVRAFWDLPAADSADPDLARHFAERALSESAGLRPGPVHLNVPFREPLVPHSMEAMPPRMRLVRPPRHKREPTTKDVARLSEVLAGRRGLIVCGWGHTESGFAEALCELAELIRCPILADPLSGIRFGAHSRRTVISRYDSFMRGDGFVNLYQPEWVLRFGSMPISKALGNYLQNCEANDHILVESTGRRLDPIRRVTSLLDCEAVPLCKALTNLAPKAAPAEWLDGFVAADKRAAFAGVLPPEALIVRDLVERLPSGSLLFSGNSMPIREIDSWSGTAAKRLRIVANRGVSGIDGNISTLAGLASSHRGRSAGLIGDLAVYHDMNGLLAARDQDLTIVVLNNGGGAIFGYLPQSKLDEFERDWLAPTGLDLELIAGLYGIPYYRVEHAVEFGPTLEASLHRPGPHLIDVIIDRTLSLQAHRLHWAAAICKTCPQPGAPHDGLAGH